MHLKRDKIRNFAANYISIFLRKRNIHGLFTILIKLKNDINKYLQDTKMLENAEICLIDFKKASLSYTNLVKLPLMAEIAADIIAKGIFLNFIISI